MRVVKPIAVVVLGLFLLAGCARAGQRPVEAKQSAAQLPVEARQLAAQGSGKLRYELRGETIRLQIDDPRRNPSLAIKPPAGQSHWDLSRAAVLAVDVENLSADAQMRLNMEIAGLGGEKRVNRFANSGVGLNPGEKRTLRLLLPHEWKYTAPAGVPGVRTIDTTQVTAISFILQWPFESPRPGLVDCRLSNLRLEQPLDVTSPTPAEQYLPFIDVYGQFIHDEWPEKVRSAEDLQRARAAEQAELDASKRPATWNRFGGWANGPQLKATGSFRTEKVNGKWWFVDPEGRLFFSHGLDVLSAYNDPLKVLPGKENWFAAIPDGAKTYQPTELALSQKYGTDQYRPEYFRTLEKRLEHWGMNSIGDWGRYELMHQGNTPYTLQLTDYDWKMPRLAGSKFKFYDVFDARYVNKMKTLFAEMKAKDPIYAKSIDDPMCIGYFIDNELHFGNRGSRQTLVDDVLRCPPTQASKQEFVRDLTAKYQAIEQLNAAWQTTHESWDALLASVTVPETAGYRADADGFFRRILDQYFSLARESIKSAAPHRLYLGARFISTDAVIPELYNACAKHSDVLSVNIYAFSAANFPAEAFPDVPVLIGEFHFGLRQRGMFSPGLCDAGVTPEDRAHAYTRFLQGALVHPNIVGAHYFQYRDQPLTGRGDSEAYQIGFVDVADTPYAELTTAARVVGEQMYPYRAKGKLVEFPPARK